MKDVYQVYLNTISCFMTIIPTLETDYLGKVSLLLSERLRGHSCVRILVSFEVSVWLVIGMRLLIALHL